MLTETCRSMLLDNGNLCYALSANPRHVPITCHADNNEDDDDDSSMCFWTSPLTTRWHGRHAGTCLETPMGALGRMLHGWVATFLDRDNKEIDPTDALLQRRLYLRRKIEHFIGVPIPVTNAETAMLACCQWATSIMLKVDQYGISIRKAAQDTTMRPRLVSCLRMTNLSSLWDVNRGMLFWVVSVCHCATTGQCFPLLTTALQARFAHLMALSEQYRAIAITPLTRLHLFERRCCTS